MTSFVISVQNEPEWYILFQIKHREWLFVLSGQMVRVLQKSILMLTAPVSTEITIILWQYITRYISKLYNAPNKTPTPEVMWK